VTLVLFHLGSCVKLSKCLIREMDHADFKPKGFDDDSWVDEKRRTPFAGLQVILYLRAGTDSAQPIRVVRDSCVKLREGLSQ
jgi:hypothetical protein